MHGKQTKRHVFGLKLDLYVFRFSNVIRSNENDGHFGGTHRTTGERTARNIEGCTCFGARSKTSNAEIHAIQRARRYNARIKCEFRNLVSILPLRKVTFVKLFFPKKRIISENALYVKRIISARSVYTAKWCLLRERASQMSRIAVLYTDVYRFRCPKCHFSEFLCSSCGCFPINVSDIRDYLW